MRRFSIALAVTALTASACGTDSPSTADGDAVEVLFPDAVDIDTATPDSVDVADTPDTADTLGPDTTLVDTTPGDAADTTPSDTTPADTADTADTTPADTTDTISNDTTSPDTADTTPVDTTPADTSDTTPADTTPADTTPADTADTTPECQLGGCVTDVTKLGTTCATAFVIGRPNAQTGFGHMSSTVGAGNDSDFPQAACGDSGPDRFYKIYLKVGEQLWVNGNPSPASYDLSYGLYRGENCETPITCVDNDNNGTTPDTMPYQAVVEGWHVLVVDGRSSEGDYSLVVTLDCQEEDCCCR